MPNWVFNHLAIEGDKSDIDKVKSQLNSPFSTKFPRWNSQTQSYDPSTTTYSNPVFAFWNIIRPTDMETYYLQEDPNADKSKVFSGDNWYSWNTRNWGTKWDVAIRDNDDGYKDTTLDESDDFIMYRFDTAWSPPCEAIEKLSAQYPQLTFRLSFEEEQGWGGEIEFVNGKQTALSEYGWKCRECDVELEDVPYCEECDYDTCPECGYGEPDEKCQTHAVQLASTGKAEA